MGGFLLIFLVLFPMAGAVAGYLTGRRSKSARDWLVLAVTVIELLGTLLLLYFPGASLRLDGVCGLGLTFQADGFRLMMSLLTAAVWMMTTLPSRSYFAHRRNRNRYDLFLLLALGSTMGIFLSGDLYTTFIFFEMMSFASYVWVVQEETPEAINASRSYLTIGVLGGLVTLMGVFLLYHLAGTLQLDALREACASVEDRRLLYAAGGCILFGFAAKAGMFPLHFWMPRSYTAAPAPATAILSAVLSKAGIFGVLVVSCGVFYRDADWGMLILILGVVTMLLGAVLGLFSINLKRTLACSSMSQIGFILVGVGMQGLLGAHNQLAVYGTVLHMVNHSLIKLILFIIAGVVFTKAGSLDLNEIRGWGRGKPLLAFGFLMAAVGVGGIPLWSGYISKTLLHESIVEYIEVLAANGGAGWMRAVEWLFLIAGGMTLAYMAKLFVAVFVEKKPGSKEEKSSYMDRPTAAVLVVSGLALLVFGLFAHNTMDKIADASRSFLGGEALEHAVQYFSWTNLQGALISLAIGAALYFVVVRLLLMKKDEQGVRVYVDRWPSWADLEKLVYRPLLQGLAFVGAFCSRVVASLADWIIALVNRLFYKKAPQTVTPKTDEQFGAYSDQPLHRGIVGETLAYELLLYGAGVVATLLYLLLQ
ncbi:MAG: proton-conducting transporter membrane subunit [Oscillospiraceae bacterium]|nr:proton-conducting transporter membrane subunit [Oscillospiraceae bacterium]